MRKLASLLLITLLLLTTAAPAVATSPPSSPQHGFSPQQYWRLWSGDTDHINGTNQTQINTNFTVNSSNYQSGSLSASDSANAYRTLLNGTDWDWPLPPKTTSEWNKRDIQGFQKGGQNASIHPPNATLHNDGPLKDAYIKIASVTPSTQMHASGNKTTHYVPANGTITGTTDYRVAVPGNQMGSWPKIVYSLSSVTTQKIMVYQKQNGVKHLVGKGSASHGSFKISYSGLRSTSSGNPTQLIVKTQVSVNIKKVTHYHPPPIRHHHSSSSSSSNSSSTSSGSSTTIPSSPPGGHRMNPGSSYGTIYMSASPPPTPAPKPTLSPLSNGPFSNADGQTGGKSVTHNTHSVTITDSVSAQVLHLHPHVDIGVFPDNSTHVLFLTHNTMWDRVSLPNGTVVNNGWHYYSRRNTTWDSMVKSTSNGNSTIGSQITPVDLNAFPRHNGVYDSKLNPGKYVVSSSGPQMPTPNLGPNISVPVVNTSSYHLPFDLEVRYPGHRQRSLSGFRVHSIVHNRSIGPNRMTVKNNVVVRKPNLSATVVAYNHSTHDAKVKVQARDPVTNNTIATHYGPRGWDSDPAKITVNGVPGELYPGHQSTTVLTHVPSTGNITVHYVPKLWYSKTQYGAYTSATLVTHPPIQGGLLNKLIEFLITFTPLWLPYLSVMYILSKLGMPTWPPYPRVW